MTKRITARIFDRYPLAWDLNEVLRRAGVDSKIVTRHAVQIHPDHVEAAKLAVREELALRTVAEEERKALYGA